MAPQNIPTSIAGTIVPAFFLRSTVHQENLLFCAEQLDQVEYDTAKELFVNYCYRYQKHKPRSANIWLREQVGFIRSHEQRFPLPLRYINTEVKQAIVAKEWANRVVSIVNQKTNGMTQSVNAQELLNAAMGPARQWRFSPLLPDLSKEITDSHIDMAAAAVARMQDDEWWQRQIRKAYRRYKEHVAILIGKVRKGVSAYVSHVARQDYRARKRASAAWLKTMYAINPELELEIPLADAVASSVSNPEIRRMELMVRMRGFEELAEDKGFVGEFYTWTAPSRYHACRTGKNGRVMDNPRYQGAMPRETQEYIAGQWAKARAKLARLGVMIFGFRVVEPHHDATPHWHMLLFVHPKQRLLLRWVLRKYACEHDKQELEKSYKPRFDYRAIDPAKGSATGYIAKYIAKNIDGFKVGTDEEADDSAENTAPAVAAWASYWSIRQFQQVGGPSVSVWRELRRLREATQNPILEPARKAADAGKWAAYVDAMGGIDITRKDHLIKLSHLIKPAASKYGEDVAKLTGLRTTDITTSVNGIATGLMVGVSETQTRHQGWELSRTGLGERSELSSGERSELPLSGGSRAPWSSDNNCTQGSVLAEKDPLDREMAMLGLDDQDKKRLLAGAVILIDGLYIRISNNMLLTSQERPGLRPDADPLAEWENNEFAAIERARAARYRRDALYLLHRGADLEPWLMAIPKQYQAMALTEAESLLEQMEYEASWHDQDEPDDEDYANWIDELLPRE